VRDTLATALLPGIRDATGEPCEAIGPQRGVVFVDGAADEAGTVSGEATLAGLSAADTIKILLFWNAGTLACLGGNGNWQGHTDKCVRPPGRGQPVAHK